MPLSDSSAYTLDGFLLLTTVKSNHPASVYKVFHRWANSCLLSHLPLLLPLTATIHLYSFPSPRPLLALQLWLSPTQGSFSHFSVKTYLSSYSAPFSCLWRPFLTSTLFSTDYYPICHPVLFFLSDQDSPRVKTMPNSSLIYSSA